MTPWWGSRPRLKRPAKAAGPVRARPTPAGAAGFAAGAPVVWVAETVGHGNRVSLAEHHRATAPPIHPPLRTDRRSTSSPRPVPLATGTEEPARPAEFRSALTKYLQREPERSTPCGGAVQAPSRTVRRHAAR